MKEFRLTVLIPEDRLSKVQPIKISAYLKKNNWIKSEDDNSVYECWFKEPEQLDKDVIVPLKNSASDYTWILKRCIEDIAFEEKRGGIEVLEDIEKFSE